MSDQPPLKPPDLYTRTQVLPGIQRLPRQRTEQNRARTDLPAQQAEAKKSGDCPAAMLAQIGQSLAPAATPAPGNSVHPIDAVSARGTRKYVRRDHGVRNESDFLTVEQHSAGFWDR